MIATKKIQKQSRASKSIARSIDILTDEISRTAADDYSKIAGHAYFKTVQQLLRA